MLRIVHCITDEKFARNIINTFEFLKDRSASDYVFIQKSANTNLRYIANEQCIEHLFVEQLMERLVAGKYDVLFLHNLRSMPLSYISRIPQQVKVVWLAWGFDIYSRVGSKPLVEIPNAIHEETQKLLRQTWKDELQEIVRRLYKLSQNHYLRSAIKRVDYFSGVIPEEYEMMKHNEFFHAQQIEYRYSNPNANISLDMLNEVPPVSGMNILVGNSADPTNNHADIFKKLAKVDLGDRKVFVPLSYAGTSRYRKQIKQFGERLWGNRFVALDDFLPVTEYKEIISTCGFRIFGHERQQAMGNVRLAFRDGCKVFLSETSIIYKHQCSLGLKVYTIQHDIFNDEILIPLNDADILSNRIISIEDSASSKQVERLWKLIRNLQECC